MVFEAKKLRVTDSDCYNKFDRWVWAELLTKNKKVLAIS